MMFVFLRRKLSFNPVLDSNCQFKVLFSFRCLSSSSSERNFIGKISAAISRLINSCGLSPKAAISASKRTNFETPEKPDSVLNSLKDNGFSSSQISILVRSRPWLLNSNFSKTILPKFEFLRSIGVPSEDLPKFICRNPEILRRSLKRYTIPCYNFLRSILHSDDEVVGVLQRLTYCYGVKDNLALNISILKELGVPDRFISNLLKYNPDIFYKNVSKFNEAVQTIVRLGFNPAKCAFIQALKLHLQMSRETWDAKMDIFLSWGWSEEQIWLAVRKNPWFLKYSKKTLMDKMNFLVNENITMFVFLCKRLVLNPVLDSNNILL